MIRHAGFAFLASALALRALIPVGYMLAGLGSDSPLALCPAQSADLVRALAAADPHAHHHHLHGEDAGSSGAVDRANGGCAFALALVAALPSAAVAPAPLGTSLAFSGSPRVAVATLRNRSASARGPPGLV